jgi:hypothetical protein
LCIAIVSFATEVAWATEAKAGLTYFSDSGSFQASASGNILTQDFNSTSLSSNSVASFTGPLNASQTGPLDGGSILAGLSITSAAAPISNDLVLAGPSSSLGTYNLSLDNFTLLNNYVGGLIVNFSSAVTAVSLNLVSLDTAGEVDISIFSSSQALLASTTVDAPNSGAGQFFGVTSSGEDTIGSISVSTGNIVGVEQVQFNVASVPEPSAVVMASMAVVVGVLARTRGRFRMLSMSSVIRAWRNDTGSGMIRGQASRGQASDLVLGF